MQKKGLVLGSLLALVMFASGCATLVPVGTLYSEVKMPHSVAGNGDTSYSKVGKATANSYLTLVAVGDNSIEAAAQNGGISTVKYVDYEVKNILGLIGEYTTIVYGD